MKITVDHLGGAYGQHDYQMRVIDGPDCAAILNFSEFEGVPHVNWIEVGAGHARQGLGAEMIRNLQARYPSVPVDFGYATADGSALIDSLDFRTERNPAYAAAIETRNRCRLLIEGFEKTYGMLKTCTAEERDRLMRTLDLWNEVSDEMDEAERIIAMEPEVLRFVVTDNGGTALSNSVMQP